MILSGWFSSSTFYARYLTLTIQQKIVDNKLQGHNFYIYVLPFTDINSKRKRIMEAITK